MPKLKTKQNKHPQNHNKKQTTPTHPQKRRRRKNKTKTNTKYKTKLANKQAFFPPHPPEKEKKKQPEVPSYVTAFFPDAFIYEYLEVGHIKCVPNPFNRHFNIRCSIIVSKKKKKKKNDLNRSSPDSLKEFLTPLSCA